MNKNVKITGSIFGGMVIVGLFTFAAMNGMETDDDVSMEDEPMTNEVESETDNASVEDIDELQEPHVQSVSIHPAGHGLVAWNDEEGEYNSAMFHISPDGEVESVDDHITMADLEENDEDTVNMLVNAIRKEFEANARSIHVMEGYMEGNQGTMQWVSHDRVNGEMRFVVEADDEIIFNESDWDSLPETDEHTTDDFESAAERMVQAWGQMEDNG